MGFTFAHIINPYRAEAGTTDHRIQQITMYSMRNALAYRSAFSVQLLTAQFAEDEGLVSDGFTATPSLSRSVLDAHAFSRPKKYALIQDV